MPPKAQKPDRPQIWSEGRQTPPFDFRAFARASLLFSREDMAKLLQRCAASAIGAAAEVATGRWRVPEARWGRTGRYLPSYQAIAGTVAGGSRLLAHAARALEKSAEASSSASLFTASPQSSVPVVPHRTIVVRGAEKAPLPPRLPQSEDPELAAIRALIAATPPEPAAQPAALPFRPDTPNGETVPSRWHWLAEKLEGIAGTALGFGLLAISLPYGAFKAGLAHLNGEDLRKLDA